MRAFRDLFNLLFRSMALFAVSQQPSSIVCISSSGVETLIPVPNVVEISAQESEDLGDLYAIEPVELEEDIFTITYLNNMVYSRVYSINGETSSIAYYRASDNYPLHARDPLVLAALSSA